MISYVNNRPLKFLLIVVLMFFCSSIPLLLYIDQPKIALLYPLVPLALFGVFTFEKYFRFVVIFSIFVFFHFSMDYRIQTINIVSWYLIFFYIINKNSIEFNNLKLPRFFKIIFIVLIVDVFFSSIVSQHSSIMSYYYALMFLNYCLTGYVVFKSMTTYNQIIESVQFYYKSVFFFGLIMIVGILVSGNIRSFGISGITFTDMIAISLLIVIFKFYIFNHHKFSDHFIVIVTLLIFVAALSRFAWLGFISSFLYGLILSTASFRNESKLVKKQLQYVLIAILFILSIVFISGLQNFIFQRFSDVSFTVLDTSREEGTVHNSLDTRALIWITAFNAFISNKTFGVGYFMFHKVSEQYNILPDVLYYEYVKGLDAHSTFLNVLTEIGVVGFILFSIYLYIPYYYSFKSIKKSKNLKQKETSILLNIVFFYIITTSIYSGAFTFGHNAFLLHIFIGIVIANYVIIKET